jgi:hypothetical protein
VARYPTRRRRFAALGVLVVAAGALIATSPAVVQSTLEASHSGNVELTLATPRATGRVRLDLSAAALPAADDRSLGLSGSVAFNERNQDPAVRMSVRAAGIDAAPVETDDSAGWPIEQLCRVAEPCQREFDVTLEWHDPQPGTTHRVTFVATLRVVYGGVESNPDGATARWSDTTPFASAPTGPVLSAGTSPERVTLDRAHPAALRHVVLSVPELPESARTAAFIRSTPTASDGHAAVRFILIPDAPAANEGVASDSVIDPFVNCPPTGTCERGVTVLIELAEREPDVAAAIEWSLQAEAELPPATPVPERGKLSALVDRAVDVGSDTPRITATASGTLAPGPGTNTAVRSFTRARIAADDASFRLGDSGELPPPAVGVLTLTAADEATIDVHVSGSHGTIDAYPLVTLGPSRPSATVLVYPVRWCDEMAACYAEIDLSANAATPAAADTAPVVNVHWDLDLTVFYPGLERAPANARLRIDVSADHG